MNALIEWTVSQLSGLLSSEGIVFLISMLPVLELRGGMLASALLGVELTRAMVICALGNLLPVPFILLFITPVFSWMKKTRLLAPLVERLTARAMNRRERIERYEFWGLVLFVGIPLPMTGAWTGCLIAALLGMRLSKALPAAMLGIVLADLIMSIVSYGLLGLVFGL